MCVCVYICMLMYMRTYVALHYVFWSLSTATASPYMLPTGGTPPTGGSPTRPTEPRSTTSLQKTPSSSSATNPLYPKGFRRKSSTNSAGAPNSGERSYFDLIPESAFDEGVCACMCVCVCVHVCLCIRTYVYMYVCVCMCMYICDPVPNRTPEAFQGPCIAMLQESDRIICFFQNIVARMCVHNVCMCMYVAQ